MAKTFVHEGVEVKLTGREAIRKVGTRSLRLVEITPVDTSFEWKKWVAPEQLYQVIDGDE
jgi:hypothetical protein